MLVAESGSAAFEAQAHRCRWARGHLLHYKYLQAVMMETWSDEYRSLHCLPSGCPWRVSSQAHIVQTSGCGSESWTPPAWMAQAAHWDGLAREERCLQLPLLPHADLQVVEVLLIAVQVQTLESQSPTPSGRLGCEQHLRTCDQRNVPP